MFQGQSLIAGATAVEACILGKRKPRKDNYYSVEQPKGDQLNEVLPILLPKCLEEIRDNACTPENIESSQVKNFSNDVSESGSSSGYSSTSSRSCSFNVNLDARNKPLITSNTDDQTGSSTSGKLPFYKHKRMTYAALILALVIILALLAGSLTVFSFGLP